MMTASIAIGAVMPGVEVRAEEAEVAQTDKLTYKQAEEIQNTYEDDKGLKLCVVSDTHYYPLDYVKDCEDYNTYVGGDPKMLAESGSIIDSAIEMIKKDQPDLVLISGDLTKDGEKLGHQHMAEKLQKIEDETDTEVFVINGNHDIYNYQDACTFENGSKEKAPTTTPKEFKEIYKNFGYNSEYEAQYFTPKEGKQAGGLSYSVTFGDYVIIGIDSGRYSPDADTGMDMNEHITAGRIDPDLLPWIVEQVSNAKKNGKTPIGLMHHGLVPHFSKEAELLSEYVVDDWQTMAGTLADAGMRYIFTGHMHANDIAEYTSVNGNKIYDLETGSLVAYGSPVRTVTIERDAILTDRSTLKFDETFHVNSNSVKSIQYNGQQIADLQSYTMDKLYPEKLFNNMAAGMLKPMIKEIANVGIRNYLAKEMPDLNINEIVLDAVKSALQDGMNLELGTAIGRVDVSYRNGKIELKPTGTAGIIISEMAISDEQIIKVIDDLLTKVENQYLKNPQYLLGKIDEIVTKVSKFGVASLDDQQKSLYDFIVLLLTNHYGGNENPPTWVVEQVLPYLTSGKVIQSLMNLLIPDVVGVANDLTANLNIDTGIVFSGIWKTAIDSMTDNGKLSTILSLFELNIEEVVRALISEYMSDSFLTGMGGLLNDYASSFLYDTESQDDALNDETGRTIQWSTETPVEPQPPTVANGLAPTQITMTQGETPDAKYIQWYTGAGVTGEGEVQISEDEQFADPLTFKAEVTEVVKPKTLLNLGLLATYTTQKAKKYIANVTELESGKTYFYRVGFKGTENFSTPVTFTMKNEELSGFTFINVNDSQGMIQSDYDTYLKALEQAKTQFPSASFVLHAGDFVDDGNNEDYWTWALDGVSKSLSFLPTAGNHEAKSKVEGVTDPNAIVSHFKVQNQDIPKQDQTTGIYYSYDYEDATFIVLNTNDLTSEGYLSDTQYNWAYDKAKQSDKTWKIILMHKSPYSNGPHAEDKDVLAIREQLDQLTAQCDVDLVLSGHDHVYNRTPFLAQGKTQQVDEKTISYEGTNYTAALNPSGTVFAIAGTVGVKNYVQKVIDSVPSKVTFQQEGPVFAGITIDNGRLYYKAYEVQKGGQTRLRDSFAIDKTEQAKQEPWKKVQDMIAALPDMPELSDDVTIKAARDAYNKLDEAQKKQVSNYSRLQQAEKIFHAVQNISEKETRYVNNKGEFVKAFDDPKVGTIVTNGNTIEFEKISWGQSTEHIYNVNRDICIKGQSKLTFVNFQVKNGATLILDENVEIDDTRTQGSWYQALNPVEVYKDSTLITNGHVRLRTEYGVGGEGNGVCVKLMEQGAKAILNSAGNYYGAESAVYSPASNTEITINDGTYDRKNNNHRAIDSYGNIEVNGGTISNLWCKDTLRVNGGEFGKSQPKEPHIPIESEKTVYMTGGQITPYDGKGINIKNGGKLHILSSAQGSVNIGNMQPFVGYVTTANYKNIEARYHNVIQAGAMDGIYKTDHMANTIDSLAQANGSRLENNSVADGSMRAIVGEGDHYVFGKYYLAGGGKNETASGIQVEGGAEAIVYGPTRLIENHKVNSAVIEGTKTRLVRYAEGANIRLKGYTLPENAFDNGVEWASNNYGVAVVNNGLVTLKGVGNARITMTSKSNSAISDYVDLISISPQIQGPDVVKDEDKATYQIQMDDSHLANEIKNKISYKWTVDDLNIANIDPNTGELTKQGQGQVSVTAQLLYDGAETDIKITKKVTLMDVVSVDITWGDMNYTFNDGKWNADTHQYDGRGWTVDQKGGDQIHIQNNGKKPINATLLYENVSAIDSKENKDSKEMINGQFLLDDQPVTDGVLISNNEKKDIRLQLQNKPKKNLNKDTIGKVTVMISQENKKE